MSGATTLPPRSPRERAIPAVIGALCFAVALAQRPGESSADTKIDLHVDPVGFLADAAAVWTNSGALGEVQGGQYAGYLFPMGPFFALGDLVGLGDWLVNRLWIGALLALAAWGTVRLMDALRPGPRGPAHVVAALLMAFNPYNVVYIDRTSVTLLGIAALPWLMLAVHRGLPRAAAVVVAGGHRAGGHRGRGRRERRGHGVGAGRSAGAGAVRVGQGCDRRPRAGVASACVLPRWESRPRRGGPGPCWCRRSTESTSCSSPSSPAPSGPAPA